MCVRYPVGEEVPGVPASGSVPFHSTLVGAPERHTAFAEGGCNSPRSWQHVVLDVAFPKAENQPPARFERGRYPIIAFDSALELVKPVLPCRCPERFAKDHWPLLAKEPSVPVVAVDEYGNLLSRKDDIRATGNGALVHAV